MSGTVTSVAKHGIEDLVDQAVLRKRKRDELDQAA